MVKVELSNGVFYARADKTDANGFELIEERHIAYADQCWFWDISISLSREDVAIVKEALANAS